MFLLFRYLFISKACKHLQAELTNLFIPHASNNHRAKILHHKSLFVLTLLIVILSTFIFSLRKTVPSVLGVATNITVEDLFSLTNQKRKEEGLAPLVLNTQLSKAAAQKATNMFAENYWAHNAPDGTTPWVFFQHAGYNYVYAGENLAKDFNDSQGVVAAWMASPSHRENMLNNKYDEIGFALMNGTLTGSETTLVVEMLGKRQSSSPQAAAGSSVATTVSPNKDKAVSQVDVISKQTFVAGIANKPLINSEIVAKNVSIIVLGILILAFLLDMIYIERRKLIRLVGHNADHILFLVGAIMLILILGRGVVL